MQLLSKKKVLKKDFLINVLWVFLLSLIFFYSFSISFEFYFLILLGIWFFSVLQYPLNKNRYWYIQFFLLSITNSISFYLVKYIQEESFPELTINILIVCYCILYLFILSQKENDKSKINLKTHEELFTERKYDLKRLIDYLNNFSIIGINGEWGSGKSFLTDHLQDFTLVKIDLLSCNIDEIQLVIINEIDKLLKKEGIFSPFSPKLKKIMQQGKFELHPKSWTQDWRCSFFVSKLTREDKIKIYERRKNGETIPSLAKAFDIQESNIKYLIALIEKYGYDILRKDKNRAYSKDFKLQIINRILINHESINFVALDIGLVSPGILHNWLSKFKENGYNVVEKKKGRKPKSMTKLKKNDKTLSEKEKIKQLEDEILYLKAENEYLKKLRALVQERELKEKKK